jgi:hypothetical protein
MLKFNELLIITNNNKSIMTYNKKSDQQIINLKAFLICILLIACVFPSKSQNSIHPFIRNIKTGYLLHTNFSALSPYCNLDEIKLSGWDTDFNGGKMEVSPKNEQTLNWFKLIDNRSDAAVSIGHLIARQDSGYITFEFRFKLSNLMDDVAWKLIGLDKVGIVIKTNKSDLCFENCNNEPEIIQPYEPGLEYGVKVIADLSSKKMDIYIDGILKKKGEKLNGSLKTIDYVLIKTGEYSKGELFLSPVNVYKGYSVCETFVTSAINTCPSDWEANNSGGSVLVDKFEGSPHPDIYSLKLTNNKKDAFVSASKKFTPVSGKFIFEFKVLPGENSDGLNIQLSAANKAAFRLIFRDSNIYVQNTNNKIIPVLHKYLPDLWYLVKIIADPKTKAAQLFINGKPILQQISLLSITKSFDEISFKSSSNGNSVVWVDDIQIYPWAEYPKDYVPMPNVSKKHSYILGLQSCTIYNEGMSYCGWNLLQPFADKRKPLLGWFDEANPEVADWQIKWQVEHGIDYELYCWYRPNNGFGHPIKNTSSEHAIISGLFNAKYSNLKKFAIMYENQQGHDMPGPTLATWGKTDLEDFRKNIIPYWIEYFFKDPRYKKIDNKPLLSIYFLPSFIANMGGIEGAKSALNTLRQECVKAGFDGVIVMVEERNAASEAIAKMKEIGVDYCYAYTWGSKDYKHQQRMNKMQKDTASALGLNMIPTLSIGWDPEGLGCSKGDGWLTPTEYKSLATWIRNDFMNNLPSGSLGQKMIMIDNWNEFGEGHFIMPSNLAGFGYLDALKDVFLDDKPHIDVKPDENQLKRFNTLFPVE